MKKLFWLIIALIFSFYSFSQDSTNNTTEKEKKKYSFNLQMNFAKKPIRKFAEYSYKGEYFNESEWVWKETTETIFDKNTPNAKYTNFSLQASIGNLIKNVNIGLNYNFNILTSKSEEIYTSPTGEEFLVTEREENIYFSLAGVLAYEYEIPKVKNLYFIPNLSIGTYQTDLGVFSGKGFELFTDYRFDLMYRINGKIGIGGFIGFSNLYYNFNEESEILNRMQSTTSRVNFYGIGFNASYKWALIPD